MTSPHHIAAQTDALKLAAAHVDNAAQAIMIIRNQVQDAVNATTGGYQSPAATVFQQVMAKWHDDFGVIINGLDVIKTNLSGTATNYQSTMDADKMSANQIAALLNGTDV